MQHTACQSAGEVMGDMFSDGLTYAGAHVRKPLQSTPGQGIGESSRVNEMKSAWFASSQVDAMAHGGVSACGVSPGLLWVQSSRTCASARNKLCCVKEVN